MRAFKEVDVFTSEPFKGNPVAVILDAEGLNTDGMQSIARWTNLSETTFVLPPTDSSKADYQLRIFTPRSEIPFAGHPTLGSAHAVLEAGKAKLRQDGSLVQECKKGLIRVTASKDAQGKPRMALQLPASTVTPLTTFDTQELESILGASVQRQENNTPATVDVGLNWLVAQVSDADALLALTPDFARMAKFEKRIGAVGVCLFGEYPQQAQTKEATESPAIEVRAFAPSDGIEEDPVCGSGNGAVAVFRIKSGVKSSYVSSQGKVLHRKGKIHVGISQEGGVTIGGSCITCVEGSIAG